MGSAVAELHGEERADADDDELELLDGVDDRLASADGLVRADDEPEELREERAVLLADDVIDGETFDDTVFAVVEDLAAVTVAYSDRAPDEDADADGVIAAVAVDDAVVVGVAAALPVIKDDTVFAELADEDAVAKLSVGSADADDTPVGAGLDVRSPELDTLPLIDGEELSFSVLDTVGGRENVALVVVSALSDNNDERETRADVVGTTEGVNAEEAVSARVDCGLAVGVPDIAADRVSTAEVDACIEGKADAEIDGDAADEREVDTDAVGDCDERGERLVRDERVADPVKLGFRVVRDETEGSEVVPPERDVIGDTVVVGLVVSSAVAFDEALLLLEGRLLADTVAVAVETAVPFELSDPNAVVLGSAVPREVADAEFDADVLGVSDDDGRALLVDDADRLKNADALSDALPLNVGRTLADKGPDRVGAESVGRGLLLIDDDAVALTNADAERPLEGETPGVDESLNDRDDDPL